MRTVVEQNFYPEYSGIPQPESALRLQPTHNIYRTLALLNESNGPVAFVFPGQGSQFVNMGIDLYGSEPVFTDAVDECSALIAQWLHEDIRKVIFPQGGTGNAEEKLNNTYYTQAAISTISYALGKWWMSKGIRPSALLGHSIGEFMAAHFAGVLSLRDALYLITMRGKIMAGLPRGTMLAVRAPYEEIAFMLPVGCSLAAINAYNSCVIAGATDTLSNFGELLAAKGIACRSLKTSHAFHSYMMQPVVSHFESLTNTVQFNSPAIPVISTVTGQLLADKEATDVSYWSGNIIRPVLFANAIETLLKSDIATVLEAGPGMVATRLIQRVANRPINTLYSLAA